MAIYEDIKTKKRKKEKLLELTTELIILFTSLAGLFGFIASNNSNAIIQDSINMNTYLLGSFTDRLRAFNCEFELLEDMCSNNYNSSLLSNYNYEVYQGDTEFTINRLRDFGVLNCEDSLNMLQHDFRKSSIEKLNNSIILNENISERKNKNNIWTNLSYLFTVLTLISACILIVKVFLTKDKDFN